MATPALYIRIAASIAELKANLAEGKSQIEATTAGMAKLASSLDGSKLIQQAHNIVGAIGSIEKVSTLTASEAARQFGTLDKAMEKMALTGKPIPADMQRMADALAAVTAKAGEQAAALKATEQSMGRVNALAAQFGGGPALQSAKEYAAAIEKVGGATNLVAGDQTRANVVFSEAITRLQALGQGASADALHYQKLADATKKIPPELDKVKGSTDGMLSSVSKVAGAFGIAFTATAAISGLKNLVANVFNTASAINDQSAALGFSTEAFQRNVYAAEQSGGSLEKFTLAANKLNDNLAGGSASTVAALTKAGLKFDEIRSMRPEQAWIAVTTAVGKIEDPMLRANAAQDLFGKGGLALLPGMIEGYGKLGAAATIWSEAEIKRFEHAQDLWDSFGNRVVLWSGVILDQMMQFAHGGPATTSMGEFAASIDSITASVLKNTPAIAGLPPPIKSASDVLAKFNIANKDNEEQIRKNIAAATAYAAEIKKLAAAFDPRAGLTKQVNDQNAAFASLTEEQKRAPFVMANVREEAVKLANSGAVLTGAMKTAYDEAVKFSQPWTPITVGIRNVIALMPSATAEFAALRAEMNALSQDKAWAALISGSAAKGLSSLGIAGSSGTKAPWASMVAESNEALKNAKTSTTDWMTSVDLLAGSFVQMAQIGGASFQQVGREVGQMIALLDTAAKMTHQVGASASNTSGAQIGGNWGAGSVMFSSTASGAQKAAAAVQSATAVYSGAMEVWSSTSQAAGKGVNTLHGAMAGAKAGAAFGPYGAAIGAGVGALVGLVRSLNDGRQAIEEFAKAQGGFDTLHTQMLTLGAAGEKMWVQLTQQTKKGDLGAAKKQIEEITAALKKQAEQEELSAKGRIDAQAGITKALEISGAAYQAVATTTTQVSELKGKISAGRDAGSDVSELETQLAKLNGTLKTNANLFDIVGIHSQGAADAMSAVLFSTLAGDVATKGYVQALRDQGPTITALAEQMKAAGFEGTDVFAKMKAGVDLVTDEVAGPALTSIGAYTQAVKGLAASGQLSQENFSALEGQIGITAAKLEAYGTGHDEIMVAIQSDLQVAWEAQRRYGYALDDTTQALVDEAVATGAVGEAHRSTSDQMLDLTKQMTAAVTGLAKVFGVVLPEHIETFARAGTGAADKVVGKDGLAKIGEALGGKKGIVGYLNDGSEEWKIWQKNAESAADAAAIAAEGAAGRIGTAYDRLDIRVPVNFQYNIPDMPSFAGQDTSGEPDWGGAQAAGGDYIVTRPTLFMAGEAGPERATFSGAGRAGGGSGGGNTTIVIQAWDGKSVNDWLHRGGDRKLAKAVVPWVPGAKKDLGIRS